MWIGTDTNSRGMAQGEFFIHSASLCESLSVHVYVYMHVCVCVCARVGLVWVSRYVEQKGVGKGGYAIIGGK